MSKEFGVPSLVVLFHHHENI